MDSLPGGPKFSHETITVTGDLKDESGQFLTEELEFWRRDPVECVKELIGNPVFKEHLQYRPIRLRKRSNRKRIFNEAWTADWWWNVQVSTYLTLFWSG